MATLNESILNAAHEDGLITANLSRNQRIYLHHSILTANHILSIINSRDDLDIEQLKSAAKLDQNTCLIYCRWLRSKGLIKIIPWEAEAKDGRFVRNLYVSIPRTPGLLTGQISDGFFEPLPEENAI
ncbi:hypothetical protein [Phormidium nigroviride]